jgi:LuxR family maltose regulon positive regulatory protein
VLYCFLTSALDFGSETLITVPRNGAHALSDFPLTRTKNLIPRRPADVITRGRLVDLLIDLLEHKLVIIAAPAGYGKTSLLVDFAHQVELPVCWYALDKLDQDVQRFLAHFVGSLARRFPGVGKTAAAAIQNLTSTDVDLDWLATVIVNDVYEHIQEHFILVLDDFHFVGESEAINRFINQFVLQVDENCHLILSSRRLLSLRDLPVMVAHSQVGGLSFAELAFRANEIQTLVRQNYHQTISASAADELARETEGWITGLLLSAQTMWQGMVDRVRVARVSGVGLYEYLAHQVLDQQPANMRLFLLRTSLLEEFDSELCEAVLGSDEDWKGLMEDVLQRNLFVLPVDDERTWLRYHHLFRDFLQAQIVQERPEETHRILRQLAEVYIEREQWENAYDILQRLGDAGVTADFIEQAGSSLFASGRLTTLAAWLDALPARVLASHPRLSSLRGIVAVMLGEMKQGLSLLNNAEAALRAQDDHSGLARTLERRAAAHRFRGHYQASLIDADEALTLAGRGQHMRAIRAGALRAKGLSLYWMGQLEQAIEWLERSQLAFATLQDEQNAALVLMELGMAYMNDGRYELALANYQRALTFWEEVNNVARQATLLNNLGVLYHLKGDYGRAASVLEKALAYSRQSGYTRVQALALSSIGDLYSDLDAPEAAEDAYRQAHEIARHMDDRFLLIYLDLAQAALARSVRDLRQANQRLEAAERLALESDSDYERGLWHLEAGLSALADENVPTTLSHLELATRCFDRGGQRVEAARSHLIQAVALHGAGDARAALSHLERAFHLASSLESQHTLIVTGRNARQLLETATNDAVLGRQASQWLHQIARFEHSIPFLRRRLRGQVSAVTLGPPKLVIYALGRTSLELDGKPVQHPEWQSRWSVRQLFFVLLAHPEGLSKEAVGEIIWPDSSPAQLKVRFKNAIYRLRRALGQDVVLFDENLYRFNQGLDYEYDVKSFLQKLAQAQTATGLAEHIEAYQEAVRLYKGSYLPDADGTWVLPEREQLWQAYVEAILRLAEHHLQVSEYETAQKYCQHALAEDECLEEAHRIAMRVHAATGNRAAVVRQYERCRSALLQEIDALPSAQTETLYKTLAP